MKKIFFNIAKFSLLILACILFGFSLYTCNSVKTSGDKLLMPFGYGAAVVISGSMEPTINIDDLIIIKTFDKYIDDDIVVFYMDGVLVVHRIVSIDYENGLVITKGDANNTEDEPIEISSIKGKVISVKRNVGWFIDFVRSPIVVVTVIICAFLLMEYSFRKEKEEKKNKIEEIKEEIRKLQNK